MGESRNEPTPYSVPWILECGCEPDFEHCPQCDERRALRTAHMTEMKHNDALLGMGFDVAVSELREALAIAERVKALDFNGSHIRWMVDGKCRWIFKRQADLLAFLRGEDIENGDLS